MRFTLSSFAIGAAALTSILFAVGAVYLIRSAPDEDALLEALLLQAQREAEEATSVNRTVQVHLLGDGKLSYVNEELTLDAFASRVELERWDSRTNVQVLLVGSQVGSDHVRLLELLARRGVFNVHVQTAAPARDAQP